MSEVLALPETKKEAWVKLAEAVHVGELQLQAQASGAISAIVKPINIEDIPAAEAQLKELKSTRNVIEVRRKGLTLKFDSLCSRLMIPEKSLDEPIKNLGAEIINLKKQHEQVERLKQAKAEEIKSIVEKIKTALASHDFNCKSDIGVKVSLAYENALSKDKKPEEIEEYLGKIRERVGPADFQVNKPDFNDFGARYSNPEEVTHLISEHFNTNPHAYVSIFQKELAEKFVDYSTAYKNKADAIALSIKQQAEKDIALKAEQENKAIAAKLEASSTEVSAGPEIKALKKVYEVDMVESVDNAFLILSAFLANRDKCLPKLRVTKWFSFGAAQAAGALGKVKSDDNSFNPQGIIWKEVDKL